MAQIRVDRATLANRLNVLRPPLDASKDPKFSLDRNLHNQFIQYFFRCPFALGLVMGPFRTCNELLVFIG